MRLSDLVETTKVCWSVAKYTDSRREGLLSRGKQPRVLYKVLKYSEVYRNETNRKVTQLQGLVGLEAAAYKEIVLDRPIRLVCFFVNGECMEIMSTPKTHVYVSNKTVSSIASCCLEKWLRARTVAELYGSGKAI